MAVEINKAMLIKNNAHQVCWVQKC